MALLGITTMEALGAVAAATTSSDMACSNLVLTRNMARFQKVMLVMAETVSNRLRQDSLELGQLWTIITAKQPGTREKKKRRAVQQIDSPNWACESGTLDPLRDPLAFESDHSHGCSTFAG
uniref:Secreted protein n=1 Tax=Coccidioides posadasii RMSCC 3488 TaxID=454284 RepID=A0A0J6FJ48_COCPO|nr:hypothetical protein CPAG_05188 [Coccidioides posadasii RMSCC 3488]